MITDDELEAIADKERGSLNLRVAKSPDDDNIINMVNRVAQMMRASPLDILVHDGSVMHNTYFYMAPPSLTQGIILPKELFSSPHFEDTERMAITAHELSHQRQMPLSKKVDAKKSSLEQKTERYAEAKEKLDAKMEINADEDAAELFGPAAIANGLIKTRAYDNSLIRQAMVLAESRIDWDSVNGFVATQGNAASARAIAHFILGRDPTAEEVITKLQSVVNDPTQTVECVNVPGLTVRLINLGRMQREQTKPGPPWTFTRSQLTPDTVLESIARIEAHGKPPSADIPKS